MSTKSKVDHSRGLCGQPDVSVDTPREVIERKPAYCKCCGSKMVIKDMNDDELHVLAQLPDLSEKGKKGFEPAPHLII